MNNFLYLLNRWLLICIFGGVMSSFLIRVLNLFEAPHFSTKSGFLGLDTIGTIFYAAGVSPSLLLYTAIIFYFIIGLGITFVVLLLFHGVILIDRRLRIFFRKKIKIRGKGTVVYVSICFFVFLVIAELSFQLIKISSFKENCDAMKLLDRERRIQINEVNLHIKQKYANQVKKDVCHEVIDRDTFTKIGNCDYVVFFYSPDKWLIAETNLSKNLSRTDFYYILTNKQILRCFPERYFPNIGFE